MSVIRQAYLKYGLYSYTHVLSSLPYRFITQWQNGRKVILIKSHINYC